MEQILRNTLALLFLFWSFSANGQGLKLYKKGPLASDTAIREFTKCLAQPDGGMVYVGQSDEGEIVEISLTKTNDTGAIVWQKVLQHDGVDAVSNFCQTADGGFAIVGWTNSISGTDIDGFLFKTNAAGEFQWGSRIATPDDDEAFGVCILENGDIVVAGASFAGLGNRYGFAARFTPTGTNVWTKMYRQANFNAFRSVLPMTGNGAILCGYAWRLGTSSTLFDPFFVNIDVNGDILWAKRKKQTGSQVLYDFKKDLDGGIIYAGVTSTTGANQNILGKVNASGEHVWAKTFGTPNGDRIWDMAVAPSGEIFTVGFADKTNAAGSKRNGFIARLSNSGDFSEAIAIGSNEVESTTFTGVALSWPYVLAHALTYNYGNTSGAALVAKLSTFSLLQNCQAANLPMTSANLATTDSTGAETLDGPDILEENGVLSVENDLVVQNLCDFVSNAAQVELQKIKLLPNPGAEKSILALPFDGKKGIQVFAMDGKKIASLETEEKELTFSLSDLKKGIYNVVVYANGKKFSTQLVKK
jgi:hypothetical protein